MAHKDIYTKFMIEYDKANVTSSYPSLTQFEVATLLDKAYDSVVDRKFTGLNNRKSFFESDIKSIQDLQPLVVHTRINIGNDGDTTKAYNNLPKTDNNDEPLPMHQFERTAADALATVAVKNLRSMPDNVRSFAMPEDMLYFIAAGVPQDIHNFAGWMNDDRATTAHGGQFVPMDSKISDREDGNGKVKWIRYTPANIVTHEIAKRFYATTYNIPWVKNPLCYIESNRIFIVVDPIVGIPTLTYVNPVTEEYESGEWVSLTYLKKHNPFVKDSKAIKEKLLSSIESTLAVATDQFAYISFKTDRYNCKQYDNNDPVNPNKYYLTNKNNIHVDFDIYDSDDVEYFCMYMKVPSDFDETQISARLMYAAKPTWDGALWVYHQYLGYDVEVSALDSSKNIDPGEKLVLIGYKDDDPYSGHGHNLSKVTKVFTLTYTNLMQLMQFRDLFRGKPIYICSKNVNDDDPTINPTTNKYSLLTPGSYNILKYANRSMCRFDSVSNSQYVIKSFTVDQDIDKTELAKNSLFNMFEYALPDAYKGLANSPNVTIDGQTIQDLYTFELSDSMASEVISTAITYALDNVESTRLQSHSSLMTLEA